MEEKYITYKLGDRIFDVPESQSADIEKKYPDVTIEMRMNDRVFDVPLSSKDSIIEKYGSNISYSFDRESPDNVAGDLQPAYAQEETVVTDTIPTDTPRKSWIERVVDKAMVSGQSNIQEDENDIYSNILNSYKENSQKVTEYIDRKQKEYIAKPRKKLKWYEKIGASPSVTTMHTHGLGGSVYNQYKKEVADMGVQDALIAHNIYKKTEDKVNQYLDPANTFVEGAVQGIGDAVTDIETWDSFIGAENAARVYAISKKTEKGEALTEGEQMIVDALVDDMAVDIYMASGFGRGYKAGKVTGESIPFMVETFFNPASGLGKSVTKKFGKTIFKKVYKKLGSMTAKAAVGATRVATDAAGAAVMSATSSQARVVEDAFNRLSGQVSFNANEDGTLDFAGFVDNEDSAFKAYAEAFGANTIEHFSEMVGNYFDPIGKMTQKGAGRLADKIGLSKINELLTEMTPNGFGSLVKDFAEKTQWHGTIGEFAEEMIGGALNALTVEDQTLKKYDENGNLNSNYLFDKDNIIDTFLGVSILGGVMSALKTIGYTTHDTRYNREITKAKNGLNGIVSEEEMGILEAFALNPMGADYANLEPFFDESRSQESKEAVAKYLSAVMQKQGYNIAREADLSGTQQGMNEMRNARKLGQNMTEADLYDVNEAEEQAKQSLINTGVFDAVEGSTESFLPQDVLGYSSYDLYNLSERSDWDFTEEQRAAIKNLAIARNVREGLYNKLDSITESAITSYNTIANNASSNGTITIGLYNGQKVYIKGDVTVSNGVIEKPSETSGYPVEIVDANTGEASTIDSSELSDVFNGSVDEYNAVMSNVITNEFQQRYDSWKNTKSVKSKLAEIQQYVGEKVFISTANNDMAEVEVQQILPNGEVLIKGKKGDLGGQSNIRVDVDSFYDSMSRDANGNPIFNQAKFNSQTQRITEAQKRMNDQEPSSSPSDIEQNNVSPRNADYRDQTATVLINGVPTEVYVTSQDNASDSIVYEYTDENGKTKRGSSTIGAFQQAIQQAEEYEPEQPVLPTEPVPAEGATETEPTEAPVENTTLEPESINWDELFNQDQEAYFAELQNQFGEEAIDVLNDEIAATQAELDALNKAKTTSQNERIANRGKKKALQAKLDSLNGMAQRLAVQPAPQTPIVTEQPAPTPAPATIDANVPDFSSDRASDARARGYRVTSGQRVDRRGDTTGAYGNDIEISFTADSKGKRNGRVKVIDAGSLVPSHIGGTENVEHFLPEAQPKKRTDKASTVSASLIAQNMNNPQMTTVTTSAYEGAPIVNKRGEVIQGNNRSAALLEMYQSHGAKAAEYKQYLIDHAADFGLDANEIAAMQNPVLVRELDVDDADAINLGQYTMQDMESGGSQMIDSGRSIAGLSNKGLLEDFITRLLAEENEETSDMNLSDLITRNGNEALKMLYQNGIINQTQYQSALGPDGRVTADARAALRGIIEQQLFAGGIDNLSVMFEVLPDKAKKAIMQTISRDLKNPDDAKVTTYLQEAIEIYYQLNQQPDFVAAKTKEEVENAVELFKGQTSLEEDGTPAEKYSNFAFDLAKKFKTLTLKQQRDLLNRLYEVIAGEVNIFGESEGKSLADAVAEVYDTNLNKGNNETNGQSGAAVLEGGNGGSQEGQQGSTGNVGVRPETGEGGQRTSDGGTDTPVFGSTAGQAAGEVTPSAPTQVANPIDEARKKERQLALNLKKVGLSPEAKQDLAFNAGKAVADMFATREEYDVYAETATDFGLYNADFERGVEESFANRQQNAGNSPVNYVPLETEPKGENNGEQGEADGTSGNGPSISDNSGRTDNTGTEGGDKTSPKIGKGKTGKGADGKKVADKYPARKGNATQKLLEDTFGFNKVEIPNSRKETLNTIYDFMMAMSKMLGISPKSIGQGGWLDVGNLRSNAQYSAEHSLLSKVVDQSVVKATIKYKYSTLRGIAHEWWHSLDHALSYFETGKGKTTASEIAESKFTGRKETWEAVRQVIKAIKESGHESRIFTLGFPRRYSDYLVEPTEMAARAFDEYIKAKFADAGIVIQNSEVTDFVAQPTPEEMAVIAPAFENLFKVLKEKAGKTVGTSVLYHIGEEVDKIENERQVSEEASRLSTEASLTLLKDNNIEAEIVSDEKAQEVYDALSELSDLEMMTVYHGSPHKFDAFDHSHMGEGEGAQAHGWGTYVAKKKDTSESYAKMGRVSYVGARPAYGSYAYEVIEDIVSIMNHGNSFEEAIKIGRRYWSNIKWEPSHREKRAILDSLKPEDFRLRNLYTVEIPEDTGDNYFDESNPNSEQVEKFYNACVEAGLEYVDVIEGDSLLDNRPVGKKIMKNLSKMLGSDKAASEFMAKAGFVGIKYDGRIDGECFVIFNESDAKITDRIEFYQTPNGTIYGWTDGKKIYLTKAGINPNTPIHEYTHLWAKAMMQKNQKGWNSVKSLLKNTPIWDEVINDPNYSNIKNNEDAVASEALSRISGSKNAAKMEQMAQQMIDEAKGTMRKLEARGLIQKMKDALNEFWNWVGTNLFGIEKFESVEQVTDRVLWDLMNKTDLGELSEGQVETQIVTDPKVIEELEASPKVTGFRNVVQNGNGTFSSPMAYWLQSTKEGAKSRVETAKFELGKWEEAEEHPELVDDNGKVTLVKPNKSTVAGVAYDPYIHNRLEPVNLQFKDAWKRDDLVYVETEVAENDLNDGYHADKALLPVGVHSWSNGDVMLSRYDKPVRIMPWEEVADAWAKRLNGEGVHFDVVPPAMRSLLVERGVEILPPHKGMGKDCNDAYEAWKKENSDSDALLFRKKMIKDFSNMTDEELYDFLDEYEMQYTSYSTDGNAYHNYIKEPNKDIIEAIKKSIISNGIDEVGSSVVFVGDYAYLVDHLKPSELSKDSNGIGIIRKVNISGVEKSEKDLIKESIHAGSVRNRRDVNQWIGAYRAKRELYNRYFGSAEDAEAALVDGGLDWKELGKRLLSRNEGGVEKGRLSTEVGKEVLTNSTDIQNAAVDFLVGEPRLRAIENAVNEEASKLGVNVTYKTRSEMPKGHQNDKGYFNTKTGEIVICTENNASIADAIQTILHEAVAHKGLRQLMGDKFDEFINRVYNSLDAETKANVDALAEKHYNGDKMVAMEEYMASLAENENFAETSVWEKIKSIFEDIINAILGRNDIKIGDNELRYILRASYNNMVNPRNMDTIRGWAQDQMMREDYKINHSSPEILSRTGIDPAEIASESARQVYDRVVSKGWQETQRQFQDAMQPVRIAIDAIQQETGNIPVEDYENYLLIQNQASSRSRVEIDNFQRKYYSPIVEQVNKIIDKILEARGLKNNKKNRAEIYKEVRQYLIAKHGLERNAYYQTHKQRLLNAEEKEQARLDIEANYSAELARIASTYKGAERANQENIAKQRYEAELAGVDSMTTFDVRDYSGLTSLYGLEPNEFELAEAEAKETVSKFETEVDSYELWRAINAATDKTLRHSYECGLLSRSQYEDIKSMFRFYIPLRGFDETTAEDVYAYARFEGNRFNSVLQKAQGRTSVADDPIATIMNMAESEIAQGNKNRAKQALYNFILNRPVIGEDGIAKQNSLMQVEDVWYVKGLDSEGQEIYQIAAPNHEAGESWEEFESRMASLEAEEKAFKSKKGKMDIGLRFQKKTNRNAHYIYLKINGVDKAIYINGDPKAADAVNGTYQQPKTLAESKFRQLNRFISSTFTNYSLEFTARNFFRDMIYSHINMGIREKDFAYRRTFRKNWRRTNIISMLKMLNAYRAGEYDGAELTGVEKAFFEFMNNGGQTGYTLINSVESKKKDLERAISRMRKGVENGGVRDSAAFKYALGWIELLNEATELVTRFAAFKTSRDMGRDIITAINDAKEITVNFNTKGAQDGSGWRGAVAKYFGWSKYFFNASVQGVQNTKAMAEANKLKFCSVVGGIAGLGFCMPLLTAAIAGIFGGDDDEEYWNIPEYERQNNLCFVIGGGQYIKIPLPIGFREVYAIGDMVASMAFNKKFTQNIGTVGTDIANKIASVILPINPLESTANGLSIWHTLAYAAAPSSAQVVIQNMTNIDWKGAPLQKEYGYNKNDPQWMKAFASNPEWMTGLAKWCNEHIDLDGDYKGMDWSPEKLDNTLSNLFGGVYTLIKKTGKGISSAWNEEERNLSNLPLASVLVGSGIDSDDRFITNTYYEIKKYYDENVNLIERRAKMFGYSLEEVFKEKKGAHQPKMQEIYDNNNFDWMAKWYLGNKELDGIKKDIQKLEKKIGADEPDVLQAEKMTKLNNSYEDARRKLVNEIMEMD